MPKNDDPSVPIAGPTMKAEERPTKTVDAWAAEKKTPAWLVAGMKAGARFGWGDFPENTLLTEGQYDGLIKQAGEAETR